MLDEKVISWTNFLEKSCCLNREVLFSLNLAIWQKYGKLAERWLSGEMGCLIWGDGTVNVENLKIPVTLKDDKPNLEDLLYRVLCQISGNLCEAERLTETIFPGTSCARRSGGRRAEKRSEDQPEARPSRNLTLTRNDSSANSSAAFSTGLALSSATQELIAGRFSPVLGILTNIQAVRSTSEINQPQPTISGTTEDQVTNLATEHDPTVTTASDREANSCLQQAPTRLPMRPNRRS